jgi:hypothetical protein
LRGGGALRPLRVCGSPNHGGSSRSAIGTKAGATR